MVKGVVVDLPELIALKQSVLKKHQRVVRGILSAGNHLANFRGRGMDFAEVRHYQAGDEIRHMEWRVTARTGRPHVKVFQEERERPVLILTDFNPSMYFGTRVAFKSVIAARLAALVAWTAVCEGDRVGGLLVSANQHDEFIPKNREKGILPWLAKLSEYTQQIQNPCQTQTRLFSDSLLRLRRVVHPGSMVVLISDFYQLDLLAFEPHFNFLARHNTVLVYHVCDPLELAPPRPACYAMGNGQQKTMMDLRQPSLRQAYQLFCEQRQQMIHSLCQRTQVQYVLATTQDNLAQLVGLTFPRRV